MDAPELIERIESVGGNLTLEGSQIVYEIPPSAKPLLSELRAQKPQVIEVLRQRECADFVHRFHGQPHAKLFPFLGRKVRTPNGLGTLLQVFADRATVLLDSERDHVCVRFPPSEIVPVAPEEDYA